jgi:hypothetical protein
MNAAFKAIEGETITRIPHKYPLIPFRELKGGTTPPYLVYGLIPRVGLALVWGAPKSGKSLWLLDLMMHVALDIPYRGRTVKGGPVVYCAFEGADGIGRRADAFRMDYGEMPIDVPMYLMTSRLDLVREHDGLINAIRAQIGTVMPVAVVLDTLNRSLVGSENDEAMCAYIKAADAIRDAFNCAVIPVHHCGIDEKRPRGHTSLTGAADAQLRVRRDKDKNSVVVTVEHMKDGPEDAEVISRLKSIDIGTEDEPDHVAGHNPGGGPSGRERRQWPKPKSGPAEIALRALKMAIDESPATPDCAQIPPDARVTTMAQWRHYAYQLGISGSEQERAKQQAFQRAQQKLCGDKRVEVWGGLAWIRDDL